MTVAEMIDRALRRDAARPFLTWYDGATGARVELSVATTANWAAKITNYVADDLDVQPGDDVTVGPEVHWTTAVVLLGAWTAGGHVTFGEPPALEFAVDAMGAGLSRLVATQPDQLLAPVHAPSIAALTIGHRTWTHAELGQAAEHGAHRHRLDAAARVLSVLGYDTVDGLDAGLLVPLAAGASVVLVTNMAGDSLLQVCSSEHVTHTVGVDVAGTIRLDQS